MLSQADRGATDSASFSENSLIMGILDSALAIFI